MAPPEELRRLALGREPRDPGVLELTAGGRAVLVTWGLRSREGRLVSLPL